ncbi:MAG: ATP synthase F1 subunit delta [Sporomusaceae bacterium]|jgi:F-type H+-transporting ATPase subunit delta|nr:ATP synthase F1 subunit delta [Sporomusaceae bacterium]
MLANKLAQTYAKALCELAAEKEMLDRVETQLQQIEAALQLSPELANLLYHPRVPAEAKKETLNSIFAGELDEFVKNFLLLLVDKKREVALQPIIKEYVRLANNIRNIAEAEVTVAKTITAAQQEALRQKLAKITGKNIVLKISVDEKILGGVIVKIGDKLIDGSVVRQLKTLKSDVLAQRLSAG